MSNFKFNTTGLAINERKELLKKIKLIPIGTEVFKAGDFAEGTEKLLVTEENQKIVTMFWNDLYFLEQEKADAKTNQAHADYNKWQGECMMQSFGY